MLYAGLAPYKEKNGTTCVNKQTALLDSEGNYIKQNPYLQPSIKPDTTLMVHGRILMGPLFRYFKINC